MFAIRAATIDDGPAWLAMREALWPEEGTTGHATEIQAFFAGRLRMPLAVLLAVHDSGAPLGFAELSIRPYAEDCVTDRVAYLEGWYVVPEARRQGVGRALVAAAEQWALAQGCTEFGSDALIDNAVSAAAHRALGFVETVQIRCFRKSLSARPGLTSGLSSAARLAVVDPDSPAARYCLERYFEELAARFEAGFDPALGISAAPAELTPPHGYFVLATLNEEPIGCGALKCHAAYGEIKRMWVATSARGLGIGTRILLRLEELARERRLPRLRLETNKALTEAQSLYRRNGFREVAAFNDEPYAHHWFEKAL